ncbi:MAG: AraC family transcriptional regulator [Oceanicaulis sp.]
MTDRRLGSADLDLLEAVFEDLVDCPFFVKAADLSYVAANTAMARLCGAARPGDLTGRRAADFFPEPLARRYETLDQRIIETGRAVNNKIDLSLGAGRSPAWLVFTRNPVRDGDDAVVGVVASARRMAMDGRAGDGLSRLSGVIEHIRADPAAPLDVGRLARRAGVSVSQLERDFNRVFSMSPRDFQRKARIETAIKLLERGDRISDVAQACGYADHSAFSRTFKAVLGLSPRAYRGSIAGR